MLPKILFYFSLTLLIACAKCKSCNDGCIMRLVETSPFDLVYPENSVKFPETYRAWLDLLAVAEKSIDIASYFWEMNEPQEILKKYSGLGIQIFRKFKKVMVENGLKVTLVHNVNVHGRNNTDTELLAQWPNATVYKLNPVDIVGGGVFHSKFWLIDRSHFYFGSANMNWKSLSVYKELGLWGYNCSCLANDLGKIFDIYQTIGKTGKKPVEWLNPTEFNVNNPMTLTSEQCKYKTFISSSPAVLTPEGRTKDIGALLYCIEKAEKYIYIAVRDYLPLMLYTKKIQSWPVLDNALRKAAIDRKIKIRLLVGKWDESPSDEVNFLRSLEIISSNSSNIDIEIRRFVMPDRDEPFYKGVSHSKYVVTDKAIYIGSSDFVGDYFELAPGVSIVLEDVDSNNKKCIREQLESLFLRDWSSVQAHPLRSS